MFQQVQEKTGVAMHGINWLTPLIGKACGQRKIAAKDIDGGINKMQRLIHEEAAI